MTSIGDNAFWYCKELASIRIPNSVTYLGQSAFGSCYRLTSIVIPDSVTSMGDSVFSGCIGLINVTIGNNVSSIGDNAFGSCYRLTSIVIPDSVISIGAYAFYCCKELMSVVIGKGVTSIGNAPFYYCSKLASIIVKEGNSVYHSSGNCLIETETKALILGCKNSMIPDDGSVIKIWDDAFSGCVDLTNITIPNGVTYISNEAFSGCDGLTSIIVKEGNSVYHSSGNCLIETETKTLILGCKTSIIPADGSVKRIGSRAFALKDLISITIPDGVTSIYFKAFDRCSGLVSITIPSSVTLIFTDAIYGCRDLKEINYQGTVEQWNAIRKSDEWFRDVSKDCKVICRDGTVSIQ